MTSPAQALMQSWLEMTCEESEAIERNDWDQLGDIQRRKAALKSALIDATAGEGQPSDSGWSELIGQSMEMERTNLEKLTNRLNGLREQLGLLDTSTRNLRRIQRSYAHRPGGRGGLLGLA